MTGRILIPQLARLPSGWALGPLGFLIAWACCLVPALKSCRWLHAPCRNPVMLRSAAPRTRAFSRQARTRSGTISFPLVSGPRYSAKHQLPPPIKQPISIGIENPRS